MKHDDGAITELLFALIILLIFFGGLSWFSLLCLGLTLRIIGQAQEEKGNA